MKTKIKLSIKLQKDEINALKKLLLEILVLLSILSYLI
ncbi:hypothetical protein OKW21_005377 [Catalinimonas alkaloidigena]|nr:hypothetical protein [Catalinimonas alkaloidigena]